MPPYDTFLSHASADKPAVEHLARKLREAGVEPFLDSWHLVGGQPWQEALEEAVAQCSTCAVFFGPVSKGGAWRNEETRLALVRAAQDASFRVIPVLLPKSKAEEVSGFLSLRTWVDFRAGLDDAAALARLIASIRGPGSGGGGEKPPLPYRCMAPAREPFVQRSEYEKVRDVLLLDGEGGTGRATTVGITTAIHGAGGFGKTALAIELCYDEQVRAHYPDGILWTTMGEEIDAAGRLARVRDLIRWWTEQDPPAFETVSAASAHLRQELDGKRVLLGVDDIWRPEDVTPFQGLGPSAVLLLTTRDSGMLPGESVPIHVDAMEVPEAVRMLGAGLPHGTDADLRGLAMRLGEWPLLLKIVNRQLRDLVQKDGLSLELALREVEEALAAEGLTVFDREDLESRGQAVARTVGASLRRLSGEEVRRFEKLAIFPEDKDIPLPVLEKLWGLASFATKKLCGRLHDLSLLLRFERTAGTIRLHDVIRAYLLKRGESHLPEWNQCFLDAFRPATGHWHDLPRGESFLWHHLVHHLVGAGQSHVCRDLLLNFQYLDAKLGATDINAVLADFSFFAEDEELRIVRGALRLSAHVLTKNSVELRGQLWGRLLDRQEPGIQDLLARSKDSDAPWLKPRSASLARPGGALIRTIDHPGVPTTLAVLPDGRAVSGSADDGTLRIWDLESGQLVQLLEGHSSRVNALAVLDHRQMISGSEDGTLRVWDVENGQSIQVLDLDFLRVFAVAALDRRRVVCALSDGTLQVRDVESGQLLRVLDGNAFYALAVAVLDHRRVVSGFSDGKLLEWDVESGRSLHIFWGHSSSWVNTVAVLDSRRMISGSSDETLRIWDTESGQALQVLEEHSNEVNTLAVLDARRVVSGSADWTLRVWDIESGQTLQILEGHAAEVRAVAVLDRHRVISGSSDGTLRVWDVEDRQTLQGLERHGWINVLRVVDNCRVISGSSDGRLTVWDMASGQALQILKGRSSWFISMAFLDNHRAIVNYGYESLFMWDIESGQALEIDEVHPERARAVKALKSKEFLRFAADHPKWVKPEAVLDGRRVVSGFNDGTLQVQDRRDGNVECMFTLDAPVTTLAIIADRRVILAGDALGRVHFFDLIGLDVIPPDFPEPSFSDGGEGPHSFSERDYRCMAPAREPFIQREEYGKVCDTILANGFTSTTTVCIATVLHGAEGFGKTAMATELCYDPQVREQYPDGVLWTTMGKEITAAGRLARVRDLIRWWTEKDPPAFETVSAASAHLCQELYGKRVLLVVDDVWRPEDVIPCQGLSPSSGLLITSRNTSALPTRSIQIRVDAMETSEAVQLLGEGLPPGAEKGLKNLAMRLREWPLLLRIVNSHLRELIREDGLSVGQAIQEIQRLLDAEGLTDLDKNDLESRRLAVSQTLTPSLRRLSPDQIELYGRLAVFREDRDIPLDILGRLWDLEISAVRLLCNRLYSLSLLFHLDSQLGTVRLHDVIRDYLVRTHQPVLSSFHHRLLNACRPQSGEWEDLPKTAAYLWRNLAHHLIGAGERDYLRGLLLSLGFLRSKLEATDINALLADYSLFERDEELRLVRYAIWLSAHALARSPAELKGQLWGRLLNRQEIGIRSLLQQRENYDAPWLRPRKASLIRPGGVLIRTIDQPEMAFTLAVLPGGRVVSGSAGTLLVWDVESGQILQILEGHSAWVSAVAVLDSSQVFSGHSDGTLRVWDVESGQTLQTLEGHSALVSAVAVLDSRRVVSGSADRTLRVWDVESRQSLQTLEGHSGCVRAVVALDHRVVSGSDDGTLRVWDVGRGQAVHILEGHSQGVSTVAVLDSRRVISGSDDGTLRVWDVESGKILQTLEMYSRVVRAVAVLDSRWVVSSSDDGTLWVWDVESGKTLPWTGGHSKKIRAVAVLDSHRVVSGSDDGTLRVWDLERAKTCEATEEHSAGVSAVAVLDSHRVVTASEDRTLRVWDVESGQTLQSLEGHSAGVKAVAVLDSHRVASGSKDRTLRLWDVQTGQTLERLQGYSWEVCIVAVLDNHRVISDSETLWMWDLESGKILQIPGSDRWVKGLAVLDSHRVASFNSYDETLRVWDMESGKTLQTLQGHSSLIRAVAVLDAGRVISGSDDKTLRVWDVESGQTLQSLQGHSGCVSTVAVLDSRRVVSGSEDWTLRVWNLERGEVECLFTLDSPVTALAVVPGSRTIVAGEASGRVHFFDFVEP